jgi:glycine cleavage system transcriptional repressor
VSHFAVSAVGRDRPGIVAAVTRGLLEHGVNIEDSQMTILRGRFSMTLVVGAVDDASALERDLRAIAQELGLDAISIHAVGEADEPAAAPPSHMVTVYGTDHPGIVHAVAAALAERDVNITDLNTRLVGEDDPAAGPLYAMMLEVALPSGLSAEALDGVLDDCRREQGVEVVIHELDRDEL